MGKIMIKANLQKVGFLKKDAYVSRAVRFSKIDTGELIRHASSDSGISEAMVAAAFYAIEKQVNELLLNGHSIELGNVGTLRFGVKCKIAATADAVGVENVKVRKILFTPSTSLKASIKAVKLVGVTDEDDQAGDDTATV